ncbi:MAG: hypothetical protein F6K42_13860 [Leptolyngbya sp. SIO1D8]|nr:hypothetical protein [Leptolyngbya sp. SIO1D8]
MAMSFDSEFTIAAPPSQVIAALTDFDSWHHWMDNLVRIEKLTDGAFNVGTKWRETRKLFGKEASEVFEVTEFEPPQRIALWVDGSQGITGQGEYCFFYTFLPVEKNGTHLTMHSNINMPGILASVFGFLMKGAFKKACDRDLLALKAHLEKG